MDDWFALNPWGDWQREETRLEEQRMEERRMREEQAAVEETQRRALQISHAQAAQAQSEVSFFGTSGNLNVNNNGAGGGSGGGSTSIAQSGMLTFDTYNNYSGINSLHRGQQRQRDPNAAGNAFLNSISAIDPHYIREIVVLEHIYEQILNINGISKTKHPELEKEFKYYTIYGSVLLKNEKYQFDLDKYIEYGPAEETVEE